MKTAACTHACCDYVYRRAMNINAFGKTLRWSRKPISLFCLLLPAALFAAPGYNVFVTDEHSGDITVIDGATHKVTATFPVGKRPRGILVSADHKTLFVAVSGTPISGPPQLDAKGNKKLKKDDDDDDDKKADKSADGIALVDVQKKK